MIQQGYEIDVTSNSVELKHDGTTTPLDEHIVPGILGCGVSVIMFCAILFLPGKHNRPSIWDDLHHYHWPSGDFIAALILVLGEGGIFGYLFIICFRLFFPSGEELHCDRSTLTLAKIPWYNLFGQWKKQAFPIAAISELTYGELRSGRYGPVYGIRFFANNKDKKTFYGIEPPEADKVIKGLKNLGVNVIEDQDMAANVEETLRKRASLLSGGDGLS